MPLFIVILGLLACIFAQPWGERTAAFQHRYAGVSLKLIPIYVAAYRVGGAVMMVLGIISSFGHK